MSDAIQDVIQQLEARLGAIQEEARDIEDALAPLRRVKGISGTHPHRGRRRGAGRLIGAKKAAKRDGRTDGRSKARAKSPSLPDRQAPDRPSAPATTSVVQARDEAIQVALKKGPRPFAELLVAMPVESGQTEDQRKQACSNALTRLRLKKTIKATKDGDWQLT